MKHENLVSDKLIIRTLDPSTRTSTRFDCPFLAKYLEDLYFYNPDD